MKILIVSDTHKKNENYFKVLEMHHPDMVIHCGDAEGSEYALSSAAECRIYASQLLRPRSDMRRCSVRRIYKPDI